MDWFLYNNASRLGPSSIQANSLEISKATAEQRKVIVMDPSLSKQVITTLIINEAMEVLVPLLFMMAFSIAYYGPNAANLGKIGIDYWKYEKVNDILDYSKGAIQMASFECLVIVLTFLVLWKLTKIDIGETVKGLTKEFGFTAAIYLSMIVITVILFLYIKY